MEKELDKYDWRHYHVDAIPKSFFPDADETFKDKEIVSVVAMSNFRGKLKPLKIGFNMPDITALMLNSSNKALACTPKLGHIIPHNTVMV